jgi:hypothetical protein
MNWNAAETNTHQDHVIAHVIGATPLGHFIWDETAYILLDIGFIWNIYLDLEMGLVPQSAAIAELNELRAFVDQADDTSTGPVETVEVFESGDERRLVLNRWTRIESAPIDA